MMQIHLPRLRQCQSQSWLDATSRLLALGSGIGAAASLCLLSILDAQHWRSVHIALMYVFCAGMLLGATCTAVAERTGVVQTMAGTDEKSTDSEHRKRKRKLAIIVLIAIELTLIVVYVVLFSNWFLFTVGILEWIIAFLFAPYLWGMGLYLQEAQCTSTETLIR